MEVPAKPTNCNYASVNRAMVVEDDHLLRDLLRSALMERFAPREIHTFERGEDAVLDGRQHGADLLLCDLVLPDRDGRSVIRDLRGALPELKVVVLTGQADRNLPAELVALGVAGFVDKSAPLDHVMQAIDRVLSGGMYFFAGVSPRPSTSAPPLDVNQLVSPMVLSERERDVVRLVARGMSSKEVASDLKLSTRTVENYRASAMRKIKVRDTVGLVRWCLAQGMG